MGMRAPVGVPGEGIPTTYNGVRFRSRLEAKWAAFFDFAGWSWEYEPLDLPGWIPDFLLIGKCPVLIEVKPIRELDNDAVQKCIDAVFQSGRTYEVLLVGCTIPIENGTPSRPGVPSLGWLLTADPLPHADSWEYRGAFITDHSQLEIRPFGIVPYGLSRHADPRDSPLLVHDRISGYDAQADGQWFEPADWDHVRLWWHEAGNAVQWKGRTR